MKLADSLVFGKGILGNYNEEKRAHLPFLLLPARCAWEDPGWLADTLSPPQVWIGQRWGEALYPSPGIICGMAEHPLHCGASSGAVGVNGLGFEVGEGVSVWEGSAWLWVGCCCCS